MTPSQIKAALHASAAFLRALARGTLAEIRHQREVSRAVRRITATTPASTSEAEWLLDVFGEETAREIIDLAQSTGRGIHAVIRSHPHMRDRLFEWAMGEAPRHDR